MKGTAITADKARPKTVVLLVWLRLKVFPKVPPENIIA
jgi:hypothetical protein